MAYRRTPRVQERLDAQRAAVLAAAGDLLVEQGYAGCSVAAVAARAGVAAGTVYSHFVSKAALLAEVFRSIVVGEVEAVRAAADDTDAPAAARVQAVVETFAGRALRHPRRAYALLAEPVDPAVERLRLEFRRAYRDVIAHTIQHGTASGELPEQDADVVAAALVGAIGEALVGPLAAGREGAPADASATVATLVEFTHRAIGGRIHADA